MVLFRKDYEQIALVIRTAAKNVAEHVDLPQAAIEDVAIAMGSAVAEVISQSFQKYTPEETE